MAKAYAAASRCRMRVISRLWSCEYTTCAWPVPEMILLVRNNCHDVGSGQLCWKNSAMVHRYIRSSLWQSSRIPEAYFFLKTIPERELHDARLSQCLRKLAEVSRVRQAKV